MTDSEFAPGQEARPPFAVAGVAENLPTHTAGPWFVIEPDKNGQPVVSARDYEVATCWHHCVGSIEREARANARLIAAAPELLEALDWLLASYEANPADENYPGDREDRLLLACAAARNAIRKALGQP